MPRTAILLNGITRGAACHHCSRHRIPWASLGNGLTSTSEGSATVPEARSIVRSAAPRDQFLDCCLVLPSRTALGGRAGLTSLPETASNGFRGKRAMILGKRKRRGDSKTLDIARIVSLSRRVVLKSHLIPVMAYLPPETGRRSGFPSCARRCQYHLSSYPPKSRRNVVS
jgi:hypothetical protein